LTLSRKPKKFEIGEVCSLVSPGVFPQQHGSAELLLVAHNLVG